MFMNLPRFLLYGLVLAGVAILTLVTVSLLSSLGAELIPPLAQGQLTLGLELPEGTPLSRTDKTVSAVGRKLAELPGVDRVAANVGTSREGFAIMFVALLFVTSTIVNVSSFEANAISLPL